MVPGYWGRANYSDIKCRLPRRERELLERLVEQHEDPESVVHDLVVKEGMTTPSAYQAVRAVLLNSLDKLLQPAW